MVVRTRSRTSMLSVSWIDTSPSGSAVEIAENRINVSREDVDGR
jgi:hypothetical protein